MPDAKVIYQSKLPAFIKRLDEAENKLLTKIGISVAGQATLIAPVDTGNLANSIDFDTDIPGKQVHIGTPVEYGIYQELGTRKMAAQPYLVPAMNAMMPQIKEMARKEFGAIEGPGQLTVRLPNDNPGTDN